MEREDTEPWYRQFWPWFIIALPASAVIAGLFTVWLSLQTSDSLVEYSDDGMNVISERNIKAEQAAAEQGLSALLDINLDSGAVIVSVRSASSVEIGNTLVLRMRHPTMAARDISIELQRAMPGAQGEATWVGHFVDVPSGRYFVTLSPGHAWRLAAEWSGQSLLQLRPTGITGDGSL